MVYWRQEKDAEGNTTRIFELNDKGEEVETGYKHECADEFEIGVGLWILGLLACPFLLIWDILVDIKRRFT